MLGGIRFYERAEIKDAISYLRLVNQKYDDLALERAIGSPKRGVGDATLKKIYDFGAKKKLCLEDAIIHLIELNQFKPKIKKTFTIFIKMINKWRKDAKHMKHYDLLKIILDESGYSSTIKNKKDLENENRLENLKELIRAMQDYDNLESFLEHVSLATSADQEWEGEKINLMTMHAAKGLEFDVVFLPGWEEGLFPHQKSLQEKGDFALEEERRLAYVGITRAKKEAFLSFAMRRAYQGDWMDAIPSRFINELPENNIEKNEVVENESDDEFDFNQDNSLILGDEYRSPGWDRLKKKLVKWKKIKKLRAKFQEYNLDGYLIPKNDEFFSEYVPEHKDDLKFISGFSGSYGLALILKNNNFLFVDGRYTIQANEQSGRNFKIIQLPLKKNNVINIKNKKIGFDPKLFNENFIKYFSKKLGTKFIATKNNLVKMLKKRENKIKQNSFFYSLDESVTGLNRLKKIKNLRKKYFKKKIELMLITSSENVAWLLNIRGHDSNFSPIPNSYLIIDKKIGIFLFCNMKKINSKLRKKLSFIKVFEFEFLEKFLKKKLKTKIFQ